MTPPNAITLARMLVVPVVVWLILADFANHERWAAVAYAIAASTDSLDGFLARRRGWTSVGGTFLDPLADKLLVVGALTALVEEGRVSAWVVLIIVAREFAVTGLRLVAAGEDEVIGASQLGKLKAFSQNVMVVCLLLAAPDARWTDIVVAIALILTVWSFADYFWRGRHHFLAAADVSEGVTDVVLIAAAYLAGSLPFGYWLVHVFRATRTSARSARTTPAPPTCGATSAGASAWARCCSTPPRARSRRSPRCTGRGPAWRRSPRIAAMLGHGYPVLLGFGGGKGVATGAGAALVLFPAGVGLAALAWAIVFLTTRYASLASLVGRSGLRGGCDRPRRALAGDRVRRARVRVRRPAPPGQHRPPASRDGAARAFATCAHPSRGS